MYRLRVRGWSPGHVPSYLCGGEVCEDSINPNGSTAGSYYDIDPDKALLIENPDIAARVARRYGCRVEKVTN